MPVWLERRQGHRRELLLQRGDLCLPERVHRLGRLLRGWPQPHAAAPEVRPEGGRLRRLHVPLHVPQVRS
jgi:hypothetical protein